MLLFPSCSKSEGQIEKIVNSMPKNIQKLELKGEMLSIDLLHPTDFIADNATSRRKHYKCVQCKFS